MTRDIPDIPADPLDPPWQCYVCDATPERLRPLLVAKNGTPSAAYLLCEGCWQELIQMQPNIVATMRPITEIAG